MNTKVYIDNLTTVTTEAELLDLFSAYGDVAAIQIAFARANQKASGFGFVTMDTLEGAQAAIEALNGKVLGTAALAVSVAWPREERSSSANRRRTPRRRASQLY